MSEYCKNCKTLADLNINQAKTIKELTESLGHVERQRNEALKSLHDAANGVNTIAFDIPATNEYTPRLVMWAIQMNNEAARIRVMTTTGEK